MYFYTHRSTLQPMVSLAAHDTERLHIYTFRRPANTKQMQNFAVNFLAEVNLHFLSARTVASYDNLTWHNFASFYCLVFILSFQAQHAPLSPPSICKVSTLYRLRAARSFALLALGLINNSSFPAVIGFFVNTSI